MKYKPLISIVLPTFNRPDYLKLTVDSVLAQSYDNFEIIISDNSDNHDSSEIIEKYNDRRIFYIKNRENIGLVRNFNKCLSHAKGDYFHFLSDDDILLPNCLQEKVTLINSFDAKFIFSKFHQIDLNGVVINTNQWLNEFDIMSQINKEDKLDLNFQVHKFSNDYLFPYLYNKWNFICLSTVMISKELYREFGSFHTELYLIHDWYYWLRISYKYDTFYINKTQVHYRVHPNNMTSRFTNYYELKKQILIFKTQLNLEPSTELLKGIQRQIEFLKPIPIYRRYYFSLIGKFKKIILLIIEKK